MIHLDATFLVDLLRESGRGAPGPATRFLDAVQNEELRISVHVACELFAGAELAARPAQERERVRELCRALEIAYPDERFADTYGKLLAWQERRRQRVGVMDLLIATAALVDEARLATRNVRDFSRVPGLELARY